MSLTISSKLREKLAEEIEAAGGEGLLPEDFAKEIADALKGLSKHTIVNLVVPLEITAKLRSDWGELQYVYCRSCGEVYSLANPQNFGLAKTMSCSICGGHLVPAPTWFITADENPSRYPTAFRSLKLVESVKNVVARVLGKRTRRGGSASTSLKFRIVVNDPSRPIASLNVVDSSGVARNVPVAVRYRQFTYRLALIPSEQHTKPVTITAFTYSRDKCLKLEPTTGRFEGVQEILFCEDVEVAQATVAFKAGHERSRKKVSVFYTKKYGGRTIVYIPARCIKTKGLVIRVDRDAVAKVSEVLGAGSGFDDWTALHTISHAFLGKLPQISGLEGGDFGEALSTASFEIAIFDNAQGGLGGIEGIVDKGNGTLTPNYEWAVRDSHHCPLACLRACKACLFTDSCYMLNFRLDRRILKALGW